MLMHTSFSLFLFFVMCFFKERMHLLNLLITLEAMMLMVLVFLLQVNTSVFLSLLTFAACEAAVGLALLVSFIRVQGTPQMKHISWFANDY